MTRNLRLGTSANSLNKQNNNNNNIIAHIQKYLLCFTKTDLNNKIRSASENLWDHATISKKKTCMKSNIIE